MSNAVAGRVESEEDRLVTKAKAGDQHAYAELLARHQAVAFRAAYLIAGSAAEAEDATQEACVKAWLALERFRAGRPVSAVAGADRDERSAQPAARRRDGEPA